jgi:hypothetical protein
MLAYAATRRPRASMNSRESEKVLSMIVAEAGVTGLI